jgi:predicted Zn finger-like uncharacterized protein
MIAACPRCASRYRIEKEKLRPEGVRLRCAKCEAVFRVRPPIEAGAEPEAEVRPGPAAAAMPRREAGRAQAAADAAARGAAVSEADNELVLVGLPDAEAGKDLEEALRGWGFRTISANDGVEAMLEIQRKLPRAAVLSAALPRMYGFQICELVKRNESLRSIAVVLVGSIHHPDRYRRPPGEFYGADAYVEEPDLPDGLLPALQRLGLHARATRPGRPEAAPAEPSRPAARAAAAAPPAPEIPEDDGLGEIRAKAERLARIIVSDIVLYNEEKFAAALRAGNVLEALSPDLEEGRGLFRDRIDERVRAEKDYLAEELLRVARSRSR